MSLTVNLAWSIMTNMGRVPRKPRYDVRINRWTGQSHEHKREKARRLAHVR